MKNSLLSCLWSFLLLESPISEEKELHMNICERGERYPLIFFFRPRFPQLLDAIIFLQYFVNLSMNPFVCVWSHRTQCYSSTARSTHTKFVCQGCPSLYLYSFIFSLSLFHFNYIGRNAWRNKRRFTHPHYLRQEKSNTFSHKNSQRQCAMGLVRGGHYTTIKNILKKIVPICEDEPMRFRYPVFS